MYLPKQQKKPKSNPFKVQYSIRFLYASGFLFVVASVTSLIFAMQQIQQRERRAQREVRQQRPGQRVVIIGAGAGGAALASSLCNSSPDLHVTVIEKDQKQTFMGVYPLAHVGHRSYDLNTSGGIDLLRAPASWNVTRDAHLVSGEVLKVLPESNEVVVSPLKGTSATFSASSKGGDSSNGTPQDRDGDGTATKSARRWFGGWISGGSKGSEKKQPKDERDVATGKSSRDSERQQPLPPPYRTVGDGLQAYPYDVLVVACGAKRTLGPLEGLLPNGVSDLDRFGIAVNPGITRDALAHLFQGNVVQVKVPPRSFCALMEVARKGRPPATVLYDAGKLATGSTEDNAFFAVMARLSGLSGARKREDGADTAELGNCKQQVAPLHPYMFATGRQHDGTFVSTTNTIWKYLDYFNKFGYCQLMAVTADEDPLGPAPVEVNDTIYDFWASRQEQSQHSLHSLTQRDKTSKETASAGTVLYANSGGGYVVQAPGSSEKTIIVHLPEDEQQPHHAANGKLSHNVTERANPETEHSRRRAHFHFLNNSYITAVDPKQQVVTLYNHVQNTLLSVPYRLLLLDLPVTVPRFVRESGLARSDRYARQNAPEALVASGSRFFQSGTASVRATKQQLQRMFEDEAAFVDVDAATLQHRRFDNIFAIGDAAGLPTEKSYGATFAQVPVVAHNVRQMLYNQKARKRLAEDEAKYAAKVTAFEAEQRRLKGMSRGGLFSFLSGGGKSQAEEQPGREALTDPATPPPPEKPSTEWFRLREPNARYDGYASFPVIMTTWRAMWPEMKVDPTLLAAPVPAMATGASGSEGQKSKAGAESGIQMTSKAVDPADSPDLLRRLSHCDNHLWNNLSWRGLRGLGNGAYIQTALYESMHFYVFTRGVWYPPSWFSVPSFSVADGTIEESKRGWFSFL